jgi:hypothetical protein
VDIALLEWATPTQVNYIHHINEFKNLTKAASEFNVTRQTIQNSIKGLQARAAKSGYSPQHDMVKPVPEPYIVKGVSTYYNKEGKPAGQWVKSSLDNQKYQDMLFSAIEGFKDEIPKQELILAPISSNDKLLNCYVITDFHLGMLSWGVETGADWDIKIAEDLLIKWFTQAVAQSPNAETAIFAQLSDFLHFDGMYAVTPASKHLLDVDSRFAKLVRVAIRVLRQVINMLLQKHKYVHVKMLDANHDPVSQIWLREWFSVMYENNPRVTVDKEPSPYNVYEFGNTALFFHHGHKKKISEVSTVFVAKFREIYGRTKYAYAHTGHLHSIDVKENNMMIVEQHRTLAAPDAYSARGGWISGRDAKVITYHTEFGEVSRLTINSDMLQ